MKNSFKAILVCSTILGGLVLSKQADAASKKNQTFNLVDTQEIATFDTSLAQDSFTAISAVNEGLYSVDGKGKIVAAGATKLASVSDDGKTYKFELRKDAKWSNGDPIPLWRVTMSAHGNEQWILRRHLSMCLFFNLITENTVFKPVMNVMILL